MPIKGMDNVKKAIAKNKREANDAVKGVYFSGLELIVKGTPTDEGRARNNWFLSVGTPFSLSGRADDKAGSGSYSSIETMPNYILNKKIYFSNNLPYIEKLEYGGFPTPVKKGSYIKKTKSYQKLSSGGFSLQAPDGWVRKAIVLMQQKIKQL